MRLVAFLVPGSAQVLVLTVVQIFTEPFRELFNLLQPIIQVLRNGSFDRPIHVRRNRLSEFCQLIGIFLDLLRI